MSNRRRPKKQQADPLTPQACPSCGCDLSDPGVPAEYAKYADQFTLAKTDGTDWICPVCDHKWARTYSMRRLLGVADLRPDDEG